MSNSKQEFRRGKETVVIWSLKGWRDVNDDADCAQLLSRCKCIVNIEEVGGPQAELRFYFALRTSQRIEEQAYPFTGYQNKIVTNWLDLWADQLDNKGGEVQQYEIEVDLLDAKLNPLRIHNHNTEYSVTAVKKALEENGKPVHKLKLKEEFIKLKETVTPDRTQTPTVSHFPKVADLRMLLSVTPIYFGPAIQESASGPVPELPKEEANLCNELKNMFDKEGNYPHLQLEMGDRILLRAHKSILAAKSPVLRARIEKQMEREGFNGVIKLPEVNARPMVVLLYWMYTGELHANAGKCVEEVVDAAIQFQLTELIQMLDKQLISNCTPENMYRLLRFAQKNGMTTVAEDISKFIMENI